MNLSINIDLSKFLFDWNKIKIISIRLTMQKQEIINAIQSVCESHINWVEQAHLIVDGINLDELKAPDLYIESEFCIWSKLNDKQLTAYSSFQKIKGIHEKLHQTYSDLFYGTMRKYKPIAKTDMMNCFEILESESQSFIELANNIKTDLNQMSENDFDFMISKGSEVKQDSIKLSDKNVMIEQIDIKNYESDENPFDELESIVPTTSSVIKDSLNQNIKEDANKSETDSHIKSVIHTENTALNIKRDISLKEQSIIQLQQEKAFISLELEHLDQAQKLTSQSLKQLEKYNSKKQAEINNDQADNVSCIHLKSEKKKAEQEIAVIEENRIYLRNEINDLEKLNNDDAQSLEKDIKEASIAKQFDELKKNKNNNLEEIKEHKKVRENDLLKLKQEVLSLEKELDEMSLDIESKNHDLLTLEEKEKTKNQEKSIRKEALEKTRLKRNDAIIDIQKVLDKLSNDHNDKKSELKNIECQIDELSRSQTTLSEIHSDEFKDLEKQQQNKRKKLLETEELKSSKQEEIKDIEIRIIGIERSLDIIKENQTDLDEIVEECV